MKALVIGGSGGIGSALVEHLVARSDVVEVIATHFTSAPSLTHEKLSWHALNASDEASVKSLFEQLPALDMLLIASGFLHDNARKPEKTIKQFQPDTLNHCISSNVQPTLLAAKYAAPLLKASKRSVFASISARVGSIEENQLGGWYSYRISKASLNMALRTLSVEWQRSLPRCTVAALHPGTTDTPLSSPFQKNVPAEKLFSPELSAQYLMAVIDGLHPGLSGRFWSWDGTELAW
ncbi:MAG: SDR family NAD(P)-dependent oxidoreductase [Pseudomonadales bacterium]